MADETTTPTTIPSDTPISAETLTKLQKIQSARLNVADRLMDTELERVKLLATAQRLDIEKQRVFEGVLLERGLPLDTMLEVDATTGSIKYLNNLPPQLST